MLTWPSGDGCSRAGPRGSCAIRLCSLSEERVTCWGTGHFCREKTPLKTSSDWLCVTELVQKHKK